MYVYVCMYEYVCMNIKTYVLFQVLVPMDEDLMGKMFPVRIIECGKHFMKAELLGKEKVSRPQGVPPPLKKGQVSGLTQILQVTQICYLHLLHNGNTIQDIKYKLNQVYIALPLIH